MVQYRFLTDSLWRVDQGNNTDQIFAFRRQVYVQKRVHINITHGSQTCNVIVKVSNTILVDNVTAVV